MARRTSEGLESLVEYNRLDLSVETLIMDESKIYAPLFTEDDREAARAKLELRAGKVGELARDRATEACDAELARQARVESIRLTLPKPIDALRDLAAQQSDPEATIAISTTILEQMPRDVVALNRLGRAYEALGSVDQARSTFQAVLDIDPTNRVAGGRLRDMKPRP